MSRSWSYSHWNMAMSCLRRFKLMSDGVAPGGQPSCDLAFGSAVHVALDAMFNGEDEIAVFTAFWRMQKDAGLQYFRYSHDDLETQGLNFLSRFKRLHFSKYVRHMGETRLYGEYRGVKLEGTADWVGEYQGVMTLADWKTASAAYDKDKALISAQLHLYAHLLHQQTPIRVKQLMYVPFVKSTGAIQTPVVVPFSEELLKDHLEHFVAYANIFESQTTWPKSTRCEEYRGRKCEYFKECWGKYELKGNQEDLQADAP